MKGRCLALVLILSVFCFVQGVDDACVYPGTCHPPSSYKYIGGRDVVPRYQWTTSGGFCGAVSIQAIALTYGMWVSEDLIRFGSILNTQYSILNTQYSILNTNTQY